MSTRILSLAALVLAMLVIGTGVAQAQDVTEVEGTTDFRNPPILVPGEYQDTIVTGEAVWYAVIYTNGDDYRFEVAFADSEVQSDEDLTLSARFVGPTLGDVGSPSTLLAASASYNGGTTNVWYLEVSLETESRLGVEYEIRLTIDGVRTARLERCDELPGCTLDQDLSALDGDLEQVKANIDALGSEDSEAVLDAEIASLEADVSSTEGAIAAAEKRAGDAATAEIASLERIADICAPEQECATPPAPGSSTPTWAFVLSALVLLGGLAFGAKALLGGKR